MLSFSQDLSGVETRDGHVLNVAEKLDTFLSCDFLVTFFPAQQ